MASMCGWCIDGFHSKCKKRVEHFDRPWFCKCSQCYVEEEVVGDD